MLGGLFNRAKLDAYADGDIGGDDPELEAFLRQEAQEQEEQKQKRHRRQPTAAKSDKLFMELGWAEQRRKGANAPVLRQVEGDSIGHRLRVYRRAVVFHIHAEMDHNAYILHKLRLNNQDPNVKDETGRSALHYASRQGAAATVRTLVHEDATIDDPDLELRWTPLHYAAMAGHTQVVQYLLDRAPVRRITINRKDKRGTTPLMLASGEDHAEVVRLLLRKKAFIDETDESGWTAMHYAVANDAALAAEVLVEFDINLKARVYATNETALEMAERLRSHLVAILLYEVMHRKS